MHLQETIIPLAEKALKQLNKHGYILGGHNGPYYDPETPVRNTAHWITTFVYCYKVTNDNKYYQAIEQCGDYLLSSSARPMKATFYCRTNPKKDFSNGTIGQAWAIEGLVAAYTITGKKDYLTAAQQVFLLHPFDEQYKLWKVVNVDGSHRDFDMTFNHQLWFAAAGFVLLNAEDHEEIKRQCDTFMNDITNKLRIYSNGLVKHGLHNKVKIKDKLRNVFDATNHKIKVLKTGKKMHYKENGYHLFNIYAFALIKQQGFDFPIFHSSDFIKALNYCFSSELHHWLTEKTIDEDINHMPKAQNNKHNIYGYAYNAPAFELAFIYKCFAGKLKDEERLINDVMNHQIALTYDPTKLSFCNNTEDENTLNARIYEYVRSL